MSEESNVVPTEAGASNCFACGQGNSRGLRLVFVREEAGAMSAAWTADADLEGYGGIVHGGVISTVLDESMAKVAAATGSRWLTAELKVRYRQQTPSGEPLRVRGWIEKQSRRMMQTEAQLLNAQGEELAHAWGIFMPAGKQGEGPRDNRDEGHRDIGT